MSSLHPVVFVDGARTPFARAGSLYAHTRADDLMVKVLRELMRRNPSLPPERIDDIAVAAATQTGDQGMNIGRSVALLSGLPSTVPGYSIDRWCAGAMTAVTTPVGVDHGGRLRRGDRRWRRTHDSSPDGRRNRSEPPDTWPRN